MFLIKEYCLNVSAGRNGGCSHSGISRVPGSEGKREGSRTVQEVQCLLWKEGAGCRGVVVSV